jgi:hypothetical protein
MKQIFALFFLVTNVSVVLAEQPLPTGYFSLPVLITLSDGSTGSGFFLDASNHIFLATARHVFFNEKGQLKATNATLLSNQDNPTNHGRCEIQVDLAALQTAGEIRPSATHDVAVVRFGVSHNDLSYNLYNCVKLITNSGPSLNAIPTSFLSRFSEVNLGEEVIVFGYPGSVGLQQSPKFDYSKPLLRKGIISGLYDQTHTIIIDSSVYFGNSGGPVVQVEHVDPFRKRYNVIGVVSEMIPFVDVLKSERFGYSNINVANSGYAVIEPVDFILEILWDK